jgi:F-type H+-transporting ATPase subunit delta
MAEITTVARPYAKAAFQFAFERSCLAQWAAMFEMLDSVVNDESFREYLERPALSSGQQAEAIYLVCGDGIDEMMRNFISNLTSHKRLYALPAIRKLYDELRAESDGDLDVGVTAAFPVSEAESLSLAQTLAKKLARQVNLTCTVNASLIGGVVIQAGDLVIDASVRGKLGKLRATLNT